MRAHYRGSSAVNFAGEVPRIAPRLHPHIPFQSGLPVRVALEIRQVSWCLEGIRRARSHPELDRDTYPRLRQGIGGPDSRSPEAKHPCDDRAGRRPGHRDAGCHPIRWRGVAAHKAGQLPCGPTHRREWEALRSNETFRLFPSVFRVAGIKTLRWRCALDRRPRHSAGARPPRPSGTPP